jgi:hypothetical protein
MPVVSFPPPSLLVLPLSALAVFLILLQQSQYVWPVKEEKLADRQTVYVRWQDRVGEVDD